MQAAYDDVMTATSALLRAWAQTLPADDLRAVERALDAGGFITVAIGIPGLSEAPLYVTGQVEGLPRGPHVLFQWQAASTKGDDVEMMT